MNIEYALESLKTEEIRLMETLWTNIQSNPEAYRDQYV